MSADSASLVGTSTDDKDGRIIEVGEGEVGSSRFRHRLNLSFAARGVDPAEVRLRAFTHLEDSLTDLN